MLPVTSQVKALAKLSQSPISELSEDQTSAFKRVPHARDRAAGGFSLHVGKLGGGKPHP